MSREFNVETFNAHLEAMWLLADDAWLQLDADERASLVDSNLDRERWDLEFGNRLLSYDLASPDAPKSVEEAIERRGNFPQDVLRKLASAYVQRIRVPGGRTWSEDLAGFSRFLRDESASRRAKPALTPRPAMRRGAGTPFDHLIKRLSLTGDRVQIGPFRLYGALELLAMLVSLVLLWLPVTLANTWRAVVLRDIDGLLLTKAIGGWAAAAWLAVLVIRP